MAISSGALHQQRGGQAGVGQGPCQPGAAQRLHVGAPRLHQAKARVVITETSHPLAVSRGTCFSEAVHDQAKTIEGVTAVLVPPDAGAIEAAWSKGTIPLVIDPELAVKAIVRPDVLVDARMLKHKADTKISDARLVIGIGPGFSAGRDAHLVVESGNSPDIGRVISAGETAANTGIPVEIGGLAAERVLWADRAGVFQTDKAIGQPVAAGETVGTLDGKPLEAPLTGLLRGLLRSGVRVAAGAKLVEVDQVNESAVCFSIRERMRDIAGGVLKAVEMGLKIR